MGELAVALDRRAQRLRDPRVFLGEIAVLACGVGHNSHLECATGLQCWSISATYPTLAFALAISLVAAYIAKTAEQIHPGEAFTAALRLCRRFDMIIKLERATGLRDIT